MPGLDAFFLRKPVKYSYYANGLFSSTFVSNIDELDLNWLSDQHCFLEHNVKLTKSRHCAIVSMVQRYLAYSRPCRHWC